MHGIELSLPFLGIATTANRAFTHHIMIDRIGDSHHPINRPKRMSDILDIFIGNPLFKP